MNSEILGLETDMPWAVVFSRVDLMPYGGSKDSGFGREGPAYAVHEMSEERIVTITT